MKLQSVNYIKNIAFGTHNPNIKRADDIQRKAKMVFPMHSTTYMCRYYDLLNNYDYKNRDSAIKIYNNLYYKIEDIRKNANKNSNAFHLKYSDCYVDLDDLKNKKAGNCIESSVCTLSALAANGYNDSRLIYLGLKIDFINTENDKIDYSVITDIDHSAVGIRVPNKKTGKKESIVVDSWLGFADSTTGAKARYYQMCSDDEIEYIRKNEIIKFYNKMKEEQGENFNIENYKTRMRIVFFAPPEYSEDDLKKLGEYAKNKYKELIIDN